MKIFFISIIIFFLIIVPIFYCLRRRGTFYSASHYSVKKEYDIYFQHGANEYLRLAIQGCYALAIVIAIIIF